MKKLINYIFVAFTFLLLVSGMVVLVFSPKSNYSFFENRNFEPMPELTVESVWDGTYFTELETYLCDHSPLRERCLKLQTLTDLNIFHRPVVNDIVIGDDILLARNDYKYFDASEVKAQSEFYADTLQKLDELVKSYGGAYYYVGVPCQYAYFADEYPSYLENNEKYTKCVIDAFTAAMSDRGVDFIDMGKIVDEMGHPDCYGSRIDNHYGIEGGIITWREIVKHISSDTDYDMTFPSDSEIELQQLPNRYVGSRSRKVLDCWKGTEEKLNIAKFKNDVEFDRYDSGEKSESSVYTIPESWEMATYSVYMGGNKSETFIDTHRENLPSVLIYGDSFTNAVESVAYISCGEMRSVDLRYYKDMPLSAYIEKYKPDIVICIRDYEALISAGENGNPFSN